MKKFFALFVLAAFVGVVAAPAMTVVVEKNSPVVAIDQSFDKDLDKDKDKDKKKNKKATKTEMKSQKSGECGSGCAEKSSCCETEKKTSNCEESCSGTKEKKTL